MSDQEIIILISALCAGAALIAILIGVGVALIRKKHLSLVTRHSDLYRDVIKLNSEYVFYSDFEKEYYFREICSSKRKFDNLALEDVFMAKIELHFEAFEEIARRIQNNRKNYSEYCKRFDGLKTTIDEAKAKEIKIKRKTFLKIEKKLCLKAKLAPPLDTSITIIAEYISPQGRNHYRKSKTYFFYDLVDGLRKYKELQAQKMTYAYKVRVERAKMTESLRYNVLRRDGFRCQICGASAKEGATLHVDHIIPVSKGGKTEMSNLRTLCDRCNLGKSDKIE